MGLYNVSRALISSGADVNESTEIDNNALLAASWGDQNRLVELLLESGANTEAKIVTGEKFLYSAAIKGGEVLF